MTYPNILEQIHQIENKPLANIVITGGGAQFIADIMTHPGASKIVKDVHIPYHTDNTKAVFKNGEILVDYEFNEIK